MRFLSVRLIISLIVGITLVSLLSSYYSVRSEKQGLRRDLERRAEVLAESLAGNAEPYLKKGSHKDLQKMVERFGNRAHLAGVAIYDLQGESMAMTPGLAERLQKAPAVVHEATNKDRTAGQFMYLGTSSVQIEAIPLHQDEAVVGALAIVHDASYINAQSKQIWRETFLRVLAQVLLIALITLLIVRWSIVGPIAKAAQWMKALRTGKSNGRQAVPDFDLLRPLAREMATFAESLSAARSAAEKEAQLREAAQSFGRRNGSPSTCAANWGAASYSWCRTASRTCTFGKENWWRRWCRPAG